MTYNGTAWVLRNETTGTDVQTVTAAADAAVSVPFVQGVNGFNVQINSPGGGTSYTAGDRFTWTNGSGSIGSPVFHDNRGAQGSAAVTRRGDAMNITTADYSAIYDAVARQWSIRNETLGQVVGTISAAETAGGALDLEGANGFRFTINAPVSGAYSSGDRFEWSNQAPGANYDRLFALSLQVGPDSNQTFTEDPIILEADSFHVIGSYTTYNYGSINMTLMGSVMHTVTWASLICGQHLSISTQAAAQAGTDKLNLGIDYIGSVRSVVGAEMRRMESTLSGLRSYEQDSRRTESRIRDVDVAYESTQYSKYQVLMQIETAMIAQANVMPQGLLQLLGR